MFIALLVVNLLVAIAVSLGIVLLFRRPISSILQRIIGEDIYAAWARYIIFAVFVVGVSGGVRIYDMERYVSPTFFRPGGEGTILELTTERWVLEVYRTVIGTLQSVAWTLLVFFVFALIAYVIMKGLEARRPAGQ